ncbi:hypothetical protein ACWGSK_19485 [Nocardiopsis sp. NPDC055551]|uniref:hypothetical protein n=1 Tax=Nocardiopsis sp. NPDC006832 TaxID=3157188 RepID=UPI0033EF68E0
MAFPIAHDGSNVHDAFEHSSAAAPFALAGALLTGAGLLSMVLSLFRESDVPFSVGLLCVFATLLSFLATRRGHVMIRLVALFTFMVALFPVGAGSERFLLPVSSEPALYLEEVGSWLVLVGAAVLLLAGSPKQAGPELRRVAVLVTFLLGVPTVWVPMTLVPEIGHTVAAETVPEWSGKPASTLGEHAWTWVPEGYGRIESVVATPSVGLVLLDHGVVGLDPVTGREVWSYRHPAMGGDDHGYTSSRVDPAGESVHLGFGLGRRHNGRIVLDVATGEMESTAYFWVGKRAFEMDPAKFERTDTGTLRFGYGEVRHDTGYAEHSWEYEFEDGCDFGSSRHWSDDTARVEETILLPLVCGVDRDDRGRRIDDADLDGLIVALDASTGRELWRVPMAHVWSEDHSIPEPRDLRVSADESAVYTPEGDLVADLTTGEVLYEGPEPFWAGAEFAGVSADSFTVSVRDGDLVRFVERDWDGDGTRATGSLPVAEDRPVSEALFLEDVVIRLVSGDSGWEMAVHPWDDAEPRSIPLDGEDLAGGRPNVAGALFVPVHETVFVHTGNEGRSRVVVGLR